jgi:hypothetical protein
LTHGLIGWLIAALALPQWLLVTDCVHSIAIVNIEVWQIPRKKCVRSGAAFVKRGERYLHAIHTVIWCPHCGVRIEVEKLAW